MKAKITIKINKNIKVAVKFKKSPSYKNIICYYIAEMNVTDEWTFVEAIYVDLYAFTPTQDTLYRSL